MAKFSNRITDVTYTLASATSRGLVGIDAQTFAGAKTFQVSDSTATASTFADSLVVEDASNPGVSILGTGATQVSLYLGTSTLGADHSGIELGAGSGQLRFRHNSTTVGAVDGSNNWNFQSGNLTTTGNATIGGTSPGGIATLEVTRSDTATSVSAFDSQIQVFNSDTASSTAGRYASIDFGVAGSAGASANAVIATEYQSAGNADLVFYTDSSNVLTRAMTINDSQNIILGSSVPDGRFTSWAASTSTIYDPNTSGLEGARAGSFNNDPGTSTNTGIYASVRIAARQTNGGSWNHITELNSVGETNNSHAAAFTIKTRRGDNGLITEKMRVTSTGNVGIGNTGPNAKLHVRGAGTNGEVVQRIDQNRNLANGEQFTGWAVQDSVGTTMASGAVGNAGGVAVGYLLVQDHGGGFRYLYFDASGVLHVATSVDQVRLDGGTPV